MNAVWGGGLFKPNDPLELRSKLRCLLFLPEGRLGWKWVGDGLELEPGGPGSRLGASPGFDGEEGPPKSPSRALDLETSRCSESTSSSPAAPPPHHHRGAPSIYRASSPALCT